MDNTTPEDYGYTHNDDLPDMARLIDYVQGLQEALYSTGNVESLESCLEEVCHELKLEFIGTTPLVENTNYRNMKYWNLGYQRSLIEQVS